MKNGVRIINCARGGIIDENALAEALKSGQVKGAALDVFEKEPIQKDSPLLGLDNIIVTPHLGASTEEAQVKIAKESGSMIIDFFKKGIIRNAVNMPSIDMETYTRLKPFLNLAEKIGALQSQINDFGIKEIEVEYSGEISRENTGIITNAYLKGLLTPILDIKVNFVNVGYLARERKIKVKETKTAESEDYTSMINAKIITEKGELTVAGTLFAHELLRIVNIKGLDVDIVPQGCMIIAENIDKPGIIGKVGTILGNSGINIARMQVGRNQVGGEAITIINIDTCPSADVLNTIAKIDGLTKVKLVQF